MSPSGIPTTIILPPIFEACIDKFSPSGELVASKTKSTPSPFLYWIKSSTDLKSTNIVSAETINGDYQQCAGGLEVRFAGATDATTANANDEWEIECSGTTPEAGSPVKSITLERA